MSNNSNSAISSILPDLSQQTPNPQASNPALASVLPYTSQQQMGLPQSGQINAPQMSTITVPNAILQHPAVQAAVQKASHDFAQQQKMIQGASLMPTGENNPDISMATPMGQKIIGNIQAFQNSGVFNSIQRNHPILNPIATGMAAFGQGITKAPFLTDMLQNQQSKNQNLIDASTKGILSPEQQFMNQMRQQQLADRETTMKNVQDQRDQSNWTQLINKYNPSTASSRSTLGMTANGNLRANRALATIQNNPTMTYQDLGNVIGDLAGIYQGGAPTDMGMKHQQYDTIQSRLANMKQFITGKPQDAVPQAIKDKLVSTIQGLKSVNNEALNTTLDSVEKGQKNLISKNPDQWKQFRQSIQNDYMDGGNTQQGQLTQQGVSSGINPTGSPQAQASQANAPFQVGQTYNGHKILKVEPA